MIKEVRQKKTGAILFKADPDTLRLEELNNKYKELEAQYKALEKKISDLAKSE